MEKLTETSEFRAKRLSKAPRGVNPADTQRLLGRLEPGARLLASSRRLETALTAGESALEVPPEIGARTEPTADSRS
ncbi:MAG: hypothetical protein LBS60_07825 [Deltaproteobacteria bacterium]|jgi:hypothetical protein|nr:hypothetical protein [Deltaproteobacteria bacterium]